jgi:hypothetical protein
MRKRPLIPLACFSLAFAVAALSALFAWPLADSGQECFDRIVIGETTEAEAAELLDAAGYVPADACFTVSWASTCYRRESGDGPTIEISSRPFSDGRVANKRLFPQPSIVVRAGEWVANSFGLVSQPNPTTMPPPAAFPGHETPDSVTQ